VRAHTHTHTNTHTQTHISTHTHTLTHRHEAAQASAQFYGWHPSFTNRNRPPPPLLPTNTLHSDTHTHTRTGTHASDCEGRIQRMVPEVLHTHAHMCIYVLMYVCMYVCMYTCMHMFAYVYLCRHQTAQAQCNAWHPGFYTHTHAHTPTDPPPSYTHTLYTVTHTHTHAGTQASDCAGTIQWMAPEVLHNVLGRRSVYDKRSDVYSYGVMVWEVQLCVYECANVCYCVCVFVCTCVCVVVAI